MGMELVCAPVKEEKLSMPSIPPGFESLAPFTLKIVESTETKARYFASPIGFQSGDSFKAPKKVTAKWRPEDARIPDIENAPVFYPTEEEFEDTLKFMEIIRPKAEAYGICRIVPPPSWKPPCPLKDTKVWENSKFATRIQRIDKLQNRESMTKMLRINYDKKKKRRRSMKNCTEKANNNVDLMVTTETVKHDPEFGFNPGPDFTLNGFQKYADDFKVQYFRKNEYMSDSTIQSLEQRDPSVEEIEGEFWRIVENPTEAVEVLYGNDIETGVFGSGFPKLHEKVDSTCDLRYVKSGWNLNNFPRLPGSVLSYESSDISGVVVPWLYLGMCFSSFCWHVEDHHLYSLNYMHFGAPKMWYGVPGYAAQKLEAAMKKHLPDLFEEEPDLLHKLVTQLSPSILKAEGVPVYRCLQNPGEFVLTFPRGYHAGFNCGFNCAEAVNVAPMNWLLHGQNAIELYRGEGRKTSISHDKLLLGAARDAVKAHWELNLLRKNTADNFRWRDVCGTDGILSKALKARVKMEQASRELLGNSPKALKMESSFDATSERECSVCFFDLHLSAAGCHNCSPDKYACLNHAKQLCSCSWSAKFFLFRYDVNELNMLVEALEGKLSSVYRWAKSDLGLELSTAISRENELSGKASNPLGSHMNVTSSQFTTALKEVHKEDAEESVEELLAPGKRNAVSMLQKPPQGSESTKSSIRYKKEIMQLVETPPSSESHGSHSSETKTLSLLGSRGFIVPSDEEESDKPPAKRPKETLEKQVALSNNIVTRDVCVSNLVSVSSMTGTAVVGETTYSSSAEGLKMERHPCNILHSANSVAETLVGSMSQPSESVKSDTDSSRILGSDGNSGLAMNVETLPNNPCFPANNDRCYRQKGPRIAKVVRRINFNIELLEFGVVQQEKLWCDNRAIYPKGFKSRVRYINAIDPTKMCYYISEILDAGRDGPLFMVSLENCPSEVFVHISASRCWELVRGRVNQEIIKQHKLGKMNLPPLQPYGSLDGMEMFGFTSPSMIQALQALDRNRVCKEYWEAKTLMQKPPHSQPSIDLNVQLSSEPSNVTEGGGNPGGVGALFSSLFKKANPKELQALRGIMSRKASTTDQDQVTRLLEEEIQSRSK
ncbi:hypothetical protein Leryth_009768 [Lithospermum erythrorhizon]|nr:hypothetical protein Leryth_009768 [Lithospermum erythrorhizon]